MTTLNTVTVTWNELDIGQAPLGGYVSFQLSAPAADSTDGLTIEPEPAKTYFFTTGTGTSDPLVANDNAQLSPAGSYYLVTVAIKGQQPYTFKTLINHANGATQTLAFLYANQAQPAAQFAQYLPLPSGTPTAGMVPTATGVGEASAWTTPAVVTLPPPTGVAATDTAAIQNAENALHAAAGGKILFQPGTYVVTGLVKYGYTTWQGAGRLTTVIQLANGANADVVQGYQFGSLTGTGSTGGITGWAIRDLMIDGNGSHQTAASWGLRTYGYNFDVENVEISGCWSDGFYSEWGNGGANMEARVRACKIHDNGVGGSGWGLNWQGPHDSELSTSQCWDNPSGQVNFDTHATGTQAIACHTYGTGAGGVRIAAQSIRWSDSVAEASAGSPGMIILANGTEVIGGSVYDVNNGASTGIVIGDGTHAPNTVTVDTFVSQANTACVNFANSGGHNTITLHAYQNSGSVVTGTPVATDAVVIKPGSYVTAPGGIPQVNGSLVRMLLPDPGGTATWLKLATWSTTAGGRLRITITGAGGYNADVASNAQTVITVSTGSGTPTPNIQGAWFTQGGTPLIDQVKCAKGATAETWDIWVHLPANVFSGNSFAQADTGSDTFLSSVLWSMTTGSDPGAASATVAVLTEQFQVQSPAYFPNGISTGGGPVATLALTRLAATAAAGYTLVNGTGTVISWTAPNDGLLHRVLIFATIDVTVTEVGGRIAVGYTMPDGVAGYTYNLSAGSQGVGYDYSLFTPAPLMVKANTTVTISQASALTSGAAKLWAEIWGA